MLALKPDVLLEVETAACAAEQRLAASGARLKANVRRQATDPFFTTRR